MNTHANFRLNPGDLAPEFCLENQDHTQISSQDLLRNGKGKLIVYFYPKALTSGCTKEACDFNDNLALLSKAKYQVVGISADPIAKLHEFRDRYKLKFDLLSDPDHSVMSAYGAWGQKNSYGKITVGAIRTTAVLSESGHIEHIKYNVKATGHVAMIMRQWKLVE